MENRGFLLLLTVRAPYAEDVARAKRKPVAVIDVLSGLLGKLQDEQVKRTGTRSLEVFTAFDKIGPPVTDHAEPVFLRGGVLTLRVSGSTWMTELSFLEGRIVARINELVGRKAVKGLRLSLGNVRRRAPKKPPKRALTAEERSEVEAWTAGIDDDAVRAAVQKAATTSIARGPTEGTPPSGPPGPRTVLLAKPEPEPEHGLTYGYGRRDVDKWKARRHAAAKDDDD